MLEHTLKTISKDLSNHKRDKDTLLEKYIQKRLDSSFDVYNEHLSHSECYLSRMDEITVMKKMNKVNK